MEKLIKIIEEIEFCVSTNREIRFFCRELVGFRIIKAVGYDFEPFLQAFHARFDGSMSCTTCNSKEFSS